MCEINPAHKAFFRLEAFTSDPNMTAERFTNEVMRRLLDVEQILNADGRFRFHIHARGIEDATLDSNTRGPSEAGTASEAVSRARKEEPS